LEKALAKEIALGGRNKRKIDLLTKRIASYKATSAESDYNPANVFGKKPKKPTILQIPAPVPVPAPALVQVRVPAVAPVPVPAPLQVPVRVPPVPVPAAPAPAPALILAAAPVPAIVLPPVPVPAPTPVPIPIDDRLAGVSEKKIRGAYKRLAQWMIRTRDHEINGFSSDKSLSHKRYSLTCVNTERRKMGEEDLSMEEFMREIKKEIRNIEETGHANLRKDQLAREEALNRLAIGLSPISSDARNAPFGSLPGKPIVYRTGPEKKIRNAYANLAHWMIKINDPLIHGIPSEKGLVHKKNYLNFVNAERRKLGHKELDMKEFMSGMLSEIQDIMGDRNFNQPHRQGNLAKVAHNQNHIQDSLPGRPVNLLVKPF
jgi:hypothetical protein